MGLKTESKKAAPKKKAVPKKKTAPKKKASKGKPLKGKKVVLTGKLQTMTRKEAKAAIEKAGGVMENIIFVAY